MSRDEEREGKEVDGEEEKSQLKSVDVGRGELDYWWSKKIFPHRRWVTIRYCLVRLGLVSTSNLVVVIFVQ